MSDGTSSVDKDLVEHAMQQAEVARLRAEVEQAHARGVADCAQRWEARLRDLAGVYEGSAQNVLVMVADEIRAAQEVGRG